jgi:capsular exopolysaccharide synthesis family protein
MNPIEYLRALKRRWVVIMATVAVALSVGFATSSSGPSPKYEAADSYEATAVILNTGEISVPGVSSMSTVAALTTVGDVPKRVADRLRTNEAPVSLARKVEAVAEEDTTLLNITGTSTDPVEAKRLANTFAEELIAYLHETKVRTEEKVSDRLADQLAQIDQQIDELSAQIEALPEESAESAKALAEQAALQQIYSVHSSTLQQIALSQTQPIGLQKIQDAEPVPAEQGLTLQAPTSRGSRLVLAALLGLLCGVGLALVLERYDTKLQGRRLAEQHFRHPVLVEVPSLTRIDRVQIAVSSAPGSPHAEAFRLLAAGIRRPMQAPRPRERHRDELRAKPATPADARGGEQSRGLSPADAYRVLSWDDQRPPIKARPTEWGAHGNGFTRPPRTILVTSPGPGEGKSTVAANLAAALAEAGQKVIVLSCDFRHPTIHDLLGVAADNGLSDALGASNGKAVLDGRLRPSKIEDVSIVPSGSPTDRPVELLSSPTMRHAIQEARETADVVILDSTPVLSSGDATLLLPEVDAVLIVARATKTTADIAERTSELLERLGAPVVGIALNDVQDFSMPRNHYPSGVRKGFPRIARHSKVT